GMSFFDNPLFKNDITLWNSVLNMQNKAKAFIAATTGTDASGKEYRYWKLADGTIMKWDPKPKAGNQFIYALMGAGQNPGSEPTDPFAGLQKLVMQQYMSHFMGLLNKTSDPGAAFLI